MITNLKTLQLINRINHLNRSNNSSIHYTVLKHAISNYRSHVDDLIKNGFLIVNESYRHAEDSKFSYCKRYCITDDGFKFLRNFQKRRIHELITDKREIRKVNNAKSHRGYNKINYSDPIKNEIKKTMDSISFDETELNNLLQAFEPETTEFVRHCLISIKEGKYQDLCNNDSDNRISNPLTQIPASIKAILKINGGNSYFISLDIRSCHYSLFGLYIKGLRAQGAGGAYYPLCGNNLLTLDQELEKWDRLFLNKSANPRLIISKSTGISLNELKEVMNSFINSKGFTQDTKTGLYRFTSRKKSYKKLNEWFKCEFPLMYNTWLKTDIRMTGCEVAKLFETKLMLDPRIYNKSRELGFVSVYEYDGISLFCNEENRSKSNELLDYMESLSRELLGINVVFTNKDSRMTVDEWRTRVTKSEYQRVTEKIEKMNNTRIEILRLCRDRRGGWEQYRNYKNSIEDYVSSVKHILDEHESSSMCIKN